MNDYIELLANVDKLSAIESELLEKLGEFTPESQLAFMATVIHEICLKLELRPSEVFSNMAIFANFIEMEGQTNED